MFANRNQRRWSPAVWLAIGGLLAPGCRGGQKPAPPPATAAAPANVRLVVFGDPELAEAVGLLKTEWHARTGGTFVVSAAPIEAMSELSKLDADAILFPAGRLGVLAESNWIAPLPKELLSGGELDWPDVFSVAQQGEASWGEQVYAVPFGSPVLTLLYRRDLFAQLNREPPGTWDEYQETVGLLSKRSNLGDLAPAEDEPWHATLEPLAPQWAGRMLLARAAACAKHRDHFSTLFNIEDFEPLIDQLPFVRALDELTAAARAGGAIDSPRLDPSGVRSALYAGQCGMAITWPTASGGRPKDTAALAQLGFAELPGSRHMFNFASQSWDQRTSDESIHVPLVPIDGRLGSVVEGAVHINSAFRLLAWLSGRQWGARVAASSPATSLYRRSQAGAPQNWLPAGTEAAAAKQYAAVAEQSQTHAAWVQALRIPGSDEYIAALDAAVEQALRGEQTSADALKSAAQAWREISERRGIDSQRQAYRHSLGLE
jgi:multiple sugar transport system substrate-binding protein